MALSLVSLCPHDYPSTVTLHTKSLSLLQVECGPTLRPRSGHKVHGLGSAPDFPQCGRYGEFSAHLKNVASHRHSPRMSFVCVFYVM